MKTLISTTLLAVLMASSSSASAHKRWLLPSDFAISNAEEVVLDFTASNNLFYPDKAMPLQMVRIMSPTGKAQQLLNGHSGSRRSSFEVDIREPGTYRVYTESAPMYFVSYRLPNNPEEQRARGSLEKLKAQLPASAQDVKYLESHALIETYISLDEATAPADIPSADKGISLHPVSHPNNLYSDEAAKFQLTINGKPAAGLAVTITPEGTRYRDNLQEKTFTCNSHGQVTIDWPAAGRYLVEASYMEKLAEGEIATRLYGYFLTVEVLAP